MYDALTRRISWTALPFLGRKPVQMSDPAGIHSGSGSARSESHNGRDPDLADCPRVDAPLAESVLAMAALCGSPSLGPCVGVAHAMTTAGIVRKRVRCLV